MYLTEEQIRKYKVMSYDACRKYCHQSHHNSSIIISITTFDGNVYEDIEPTDYNNVRDILYLRFCDVTYEDNSQSCMQEEDAQAIADFVNEYYNKVDRIIVHCEGGISRSAGVAAAIMRVKEGADWPIFDNRNKHPNMTCYLRTLKAFGYKLLK